MRRPAGTPGLYWNGADLEIEVAELLAHLGVTESPPPPDLVAVVVHAASEVAARAGCELEVHR